MQLGEAPGAATKGDWPTVSVVIPVRDGAAAIDTCLNAVLNQDYPGSIECVVADGASTDGTRTLLDAWSARDMRLRVVDNPTATTPAGLNAAIEIARGEVIARCDIHAALPPDYLRTAVEVLETTGADVVGGVQRAEGESLLERAIALGMTTPMGVGDAKFRFGGRPGPTDTVYLGVFRRSIFDRAGRFDESLERNQDYELNWRVRDTGGVVYFHPDLEVTYRPRSSLSGLWDQYFAYGRWKRKVLAKHPRSLRIRQLAPPLLVLGLAASIGLSVGRWRNLGAVVPAVYAVALAGSSLWIGFRRRDPAAVLLPAVFPTMHIGWGLGFLIGPPS